jgi:Transketolase, C-terminal domain
LNDKGEPIYGEKYAFDGRASVVSGFGDTRDQATIVSYGAALHEATKAAKLLAEGDRPVRVLNMACIRPMDAGAVLRAAFETQHLIVVEDHNTEGGLATQIADLIADLSLPCTLTRLGVRHYFPSATSEVLVTLAGLDAESIANAVEDQFAFRLAGGEETFVSCLYALIDRLPATRFAVSAAEYVSRLRTDLPYLRSLRELWKARGFADELPTNEDLIERLRVREDLSELNPITGMPLHGQKNIGIL